MSPPQKAHIRMLETLPREQIRTHRWEPKALPQGSRRNHDQRVALLSRLRELEKLGCTRKEMNKICGCTNKTIVRYLGNAKCRGRPRSAK